MKRYISNSPTETEQIGNEIALTLTGGEVLAFRGDLGAGKTCFTRGLARGLGFLGAVNSPTFAIVNEYLGGRIKLYHFDMYRIENWDDLYSTGFFDYLSDDAVLAVEWSENIEGALPDNTTYITIEKDGENRRIITVDTRS